MKKPLFIRNANQLITMRSNSNVPMKKNEMNNLEIIENGSIWIDKGKIVYIGEDSEVLKKVSDRLYESTIIDATGKLVTPGLVDSHTHLIYGGSREKEFEMRLDGASYMDIMNAGGGIHRTTTDTRSSSQNDLYEQALSRLNSSLLYGTTSIEIKSGYGLTTENELKQLQVAKRLNNTHPIEVTSTFLGAHAVPVEYEGAPDDYVNYIINDMLPIVSKNNLAEFIDVFCEKDVFTTEQSKKILKAGKQHGLIPKIHADEMVPSGGAEVAAEVGAISAEHLLQVTDEGIKKMIENDVIAILLPGTPFMLKLKPANARKMIDKGLSVALSTDNNPGTSPTESLPFIMNLGCLTMNMTPAEVLAATTINAACAINKHDKIGSLEIGKQGDVVLFDADSYSFLQYKFGMNLVDTVVKNGEIVVKNKTLTY